MTIVAIDHETASEAMKGSCVDKDELFAFWEAVRSGPSKDDMEKAYRELISREMVPVALSKLVSKLTGSSSNSCVLAFDSPFQVAQDKKVARIEVDGESVKLVTEDDLVLGYSVPGDPEPGDNVILFISLDNFLPEHRS